MPDTPEPPPASPPSKEALTETKLSWLRERQKEKKVAKDADHTSWFHAISWAMGVGCLGIIIYAATERSANFFGVLGCAVLIGLAATLAGAFAGFIFGIPKTVAAGSGGTSTAAAAAAAAAYQGNTNLEQISDWLTKILVGAGLVELKQIYGLLQDFGSQFIKHPVLGKLGWIVAPALVITYSICGFLLAYLWARIYMTADLEERAAAAAERQVVAGLPAGTPVSPTATSTTEADPPAGR